MERDEGERPLENTRLFLLLAQAACSAHSQHLLYPVVKKLPTGLEQISS